MAFKLGIADGYLDFLFTLKAFLTSYNKIDTIIKTAGAGTGWMSREWAADDSGIVLDTWTIYFDSTTTYTVTGADSSHGLQSATGTVDVDYTTDGGECGWRIVAGSVAFAIGDTFTCITEAGMASTQAWDVNRYNMVYDTDIDDSGVVDASTKGTIGNPNYNMWAPSEETWTITCVTSGSSGVPAVFGVVGSISGAKANATADVAYDNGLVSFTITTGAVDWDGSSGAADTITFLVPTAREVFFEAPGNADDEDIFTHIRTYYQAVGGGQDVYQWMLCGCSGFDSTKNFWNMPDTPALVSGNQSDTNNYITRCVHQNRDMPYWIVANGRRVVCFYDVNGVIETFHLGLILPYAFPTDNPYPLLVGGTTCRSAHDYTSIAYYHRAWFDPPMEWYLYMGDEAQVFFWIQSTIIRIGNTSSSVYTNSMLTENEGAMAPYLSAGGGGGAITWEGMADVGPDDTLAFYSICPWCRLGSKGVFGEVEGVYAVMGGTLNAFDVINSGGVDYVMFPNVHITERLSWCALRLE